LKKYGYQGLRGSRKRSKRFYQNHLKKILSEAYYKLSKVKDKERILKTAKENVKSHIRESLIRLTAEFSAETLQIRRNEMIYLQSKKKQSNFQPRIVYKEQSEMSFQDKTKHNKQRKHQKTKPNPEKIHHYQKCLT
jgi:hypothetical protein